MSFGNLEIKRKKLPLSNCNTPLLCHTKPYHNLVQIKYFLLLFQKISMDLDLHKIHYPQCLLTHPMLLVLSVDTAVLMTIVAVKYDGDQLE